MSGLFLIVSNFDDVRWISLFQATKGGYPHITVFYSGQKLPLLTLNALAEKFFTYTSLLPTPKEMTLSPEHVYVNSFFEEKTQKQRYDVLVNLEPQDEEWITTMRGRIVQKELENFVTMRRPHITHSIHYDEEKAHQTMDALKLALPINMYITGATID